MSNASSKPLHVVVGANGPLGSWVVKKLLDRGDLRVRAVSRSGGGDHAPGVELASGDAFDHDSITKACEGAAVIYHTMNAPYTKWTSMLEPMMVGLIAAAERTGAKLVYADNLYCYGPVNGPIHEDLPWAAKTRKGGTRKRVLDILFRAHNERRIRATVGMASDFYGPGVLMSHFGEQMIGNIIEGKPGDFIGDPAMPHSYAYIEDFARDLVTLAFDERADGTTWHVTHAPATTMNDAVELVGQLLDKPAQIKAMPPFMLGLLSLFVPILRELKEMSYQFTKPFVVSDTRFRELFGGEPTPLEEGLKRTVDWYRETVA